MSPITKRLSVACTWQRAHSRLPRKMLCKRAVLAFFALDSIELDMEAALRFEAANCTAAPAVTKAALPDEAEHELAGPSAGPPVIAF